MKKQNLLLLCLCVLIVLGAFVFAPKGSEYGGADGSAEEAVSELQKDYEPWFESPYKPASGEVESLLFTLQGSLGAGVVAYIIGYQKGKNKYANH